MKKENEMNEQEMVEINQFPVNAKIGMVLTTYSNHLPFLSYALTQYRKVKDMYIIGAFDPRLIRKDSPERNIPFTDIITKAHSWVFKHHTFGGHAKRHGWIWSHIYASSILRTFDNIEWIVSANGDCCWDRPEGIHEIIAMMEDKELYFMSGQSFTRHTDGFNFIHTCSMIFHAEAYWDFIDYVTDNVFGEKKTISFSPEGLIQQWLRKDDWKWEHAPVQPKYPNGDHDFYCECNSDSTWKRHLKFRNIEAEKRYRQENHLEPIQKKYFDLRDKKWYRDQDKQLIDYYRSGNEECIKEWWRYADLQMAKREKRDKEIKAARKKTKG